MENFIFGQPKCMGCRNRNHAHGQQNAIHPVPEQSYLEVSNITFSNITLSNITSFVNILGYSYYHFRLLVDKVSKILLYNWNIEFLINNVLPFLA